MSATELAEVGKSIAERLDDMTTGLNSLSSHPRWELTHAMSVRPADLSVAQIAALLVILTPVDSRVIGGPAGRPMVRVLGVGRNHPASNLA